MHCVDGGFRGGMILSALIALSIPLAPNVQADDPPGKPKRPAIYDRNADGNKQIADALLIAKRDNKRPLLMFGANWCSWCYRLHELFKTDKEIARKLLYEYVWVLIDVDKINGSTHNAEVDKRYGQPTKHGLPVLVVLDRDGKQVTTQETGALEIGDHHDPKKVLAFLEKWQPNPVSAQETLSAGLARAKAESRNVFVYFSAPWCVWCKRLDAYLHRPEITEIFSKAFVPVQIDLDRMTGAKAIEAKYRAPQSEGLPFFVLLDSQAKKLADSVAKEGNVGCPVEPAEIAHFMKVVRAHGPGLTPEELAVLEKGLGKPDS